MLPVSPAHLGLRIVAIVLLSVGYVVGSHWLMTSPHPTPWNAVGVLTPMLAAIAIGAWRAGQRMIGAVAGLAIAALCVPALLGLQPSAQLLYLAQHVGVNVFLALGFGSTLRAGQTSMITTMAMRVHRVFTPAMAVYTRKVTVAWTLYFVAMALLSVLLYAFASFEVWALFANILTPIAVGAMFFAEYLLRYRLHPEFERTSVADAIRSYRQSGKPAVAVQADPSR